ncbi:MAG TPA: flavin reductase [Clostridiales bacterium]|nr:flavin reductase [Clostridiales bacterium]
MDVTALFNLSYGLYIIGTKYGDRKAGCVVNTVTQSTSKPVTLTVCVNRDNYTNACMKQCREFTVSILSEKAKESTFGVFGFSCSKDRDKFAEVSSALTSSGLPYVTEGVTGYLECKIINFIDNFTHTVFIAEVVDAENLMKEPPMTYAYYHNVVKGKTPQKASSYAGDDAEYGAAYTCSVCGYEYAGTKEAFTGLPNDYVCPICQAPKSKFVSASTAI